MQAGDRSSDLFLKKDRKEREHRNIAFFIGVVFCNPLPLEMFPRVPIFASC
jgi:hypothetical protein